MSKDIGAAIIVIFILFFACLGIFAVALQEQSKKREIQEQVVQLQAKIKELHQPKYINVVIKFTAKQTDEYEHSLLVDVDDGTEWGNWLFEHIKECKQCRVSFVRNPAVGICEKAFGKFMEINKKEKEKK